MEKKFTRIIGLLLILIFWSAGGCVEEFTYDPGGPIPEAKLSPVSRLWTDEQVDAMVVMEQESIYSPAPRENGVPPAECDFVRFLRFRLREASGDPADADACLLMVPGILAGANSFEYLGRQLVYIAKNEYGLDTEVWAFDRRNNCLEDLTGCEAGEAAGDADSMIDTVMGYYYLGEEIDGRTFDGFLTNDDVPYLSDFGLRMDTEDMFTIITTMIPDPQVRREKVFVGGHSLGGLHTGYFAGWDVDGDQSTLGDAGFMNCAGLFAFDSVVVPIPLVVQHVLSEYLSFLPDWIVDPVFDMTETVYAGAVEQLRSGATPPLIPTELVTQSPVDAEIMFIVEPFAMAGSFDPDGEVSRFYDTIEPLASHNLLELMRMLQSRSRAHYNDHTPDLFDFRYTNEAVNGIIWDDDLIHISMIRLSLGHLNGGAVVCKDSDVGPLHRGLFTTIDAGPDLDHLGEGPLYSWADFDEIGSTSDPDYRSTDGTTTYTTMTDEVSDIKDLTRALYKGPSNLVEWYFSTRRVADMVAGVFDYAPRYGINFLHGDEVEAMPSITFIAESGVLDDFLISLIPGHEDFIMLEGFDHMDPMFQSVNTPCHRENEVVYPLIDFIVDNL